MKSTLSILAIATMFLVSCGGSTQTQPEAQTDSVATEAVVDSTATVSDSTAVEAPASEVTETPVQ